MSNVKIKPQQFEKAVINALGEYGDETNEKLEVMLKTAARETRREMKATSPVNQGKYARGWSNKAQKVGRFNLNQTVYNRDAYQLIHLLEKPHSTGGGGHYPSKKDHTGIMARVEEEQTQKFFQEVLNKL
jgi:hypothetical protein